MTHSLRTLSAAALALALSACGGGSGEDFSVDTKASPAQVAAALSAVSLNDAEMLFGNLPVTRDRPREGELVWTVQSSEVPGKRGDPGTIALRFEPLENGESTRIHVAIAVPQVRMLMGQPNMVLSEAKVEQTFRKTLETMARHLDKRADTSGDAQAIGMLLGAVAVSANADLQARANRFKKDPAAAVAAAGRGDAAADAEYADRDYEDRFNSRGESREYEDANTLDRADAE